MRVPPAIAFCVSWLAAQVPFASASSEDPFASADVVSEIGVARLAEDAGDAALLAKLTALDRREHTLIAARASSYARAPELLVPALAKLACGRDPDLASQAANTLRRLADRRWTSELSEREALRSDLVAARQSLSCVEKAALLRADIPLLVAQLSSQLDAQTR